MNKTYLLLGIVAVLMGVGRVVISDWPGTAGRQPGYVAPPGRAGRPGGPPAVHLRQVLTGAGLILIGAGAVAGAWANLGPGPLNAADVVMLILVVPGIVLIIGRSYLSRQPWLGHLVAGLLRQRS